MGQLAFILNEEDVLSDESPSLLVLDYLRKVREITGTKEGCKEGDCGACTVLVGELTEEGKVSYVPMTSCLLPLGDVAGKHLVSIEGVNMPELTPVQKAIVEEGGTQCGYCTPGFVMSMTGFIMDSSKTLDLDGLKYAWSGNLCRCTGYRSLKCTLPHLKEDLQKVLLKEDRVNALCEQGSLPVYFQAIPARLKALSHSLADLPDSKDAVEALAVAGGTDLYVQQGETLPEKSVHFLGVTNLKPDIFEDEGAIVVEAKTTFEAFGQSELIGSVIPDIKRYNDVIASWPVRTRATLGGNIINASPIADMTSLFLALNAQLVFENKGDYRTVALKDFYLGYKKMDKELGDILKWIRFKKPNQKTCIHWEKVSKREVLDIASVNSGALLEIEDGVILSAHLSMGGVAAVPLYLQETSAFLVGKKVEPELLAKVIEKSQIEFDPISDIRGSAYYKRLLARQLIIAHFSKIIPELFTAELLLTVNGVVQ